MRETVLRMRDLVAMVVVAAIVIAMIPTVVFAASNTGSVGGSFQLGNSLPVVNSVGLYNTENASQGTILPQTEMVIQVDVSDNDTMNNIATIVVTLWYDASGLGTMPTATDNETCAIFTWSSGGGFALDSDMTDSTWGLHGETPTVMTATSGVFRFHFTAGRTATEASGNPDQWRIHAEVIDAATASDTGSQDGRAMAWYGEVETTSASVNWGSVTANSDYAANVQTGISVTYFANGNYKQQVAASTPWSSTAVLNEAGTPGANEFSLKASATNNIDNAVQVTSTTTGYAPIDETGVQTDEGGDPVSTNTLWLKVGTPFDLGAYSGTIYYQIANR